MDQIIIPDSPNWIFVNSKNIFDTNSNSFIYASHKKLIISQIPTGKVQSVLFSPKESNFLLVAVDSNQDRFSAFTSDNFIRTYSLKALQEIEKFPIKDCVGLKYWGNNLACVFTNKCLVYRGSEISNEYPINGFYSVSVHEEYIGIAQNGIVEIFDFLNKFEISGTYSVIDLQKFDDIYVLLINTSSVVAYKRNNKICEVPLKRASSKLKQPVFSISWVSQNRFVYSTLSGEITIINISPFLSQSFLNNPHSKAIISLAFTNFGLLSIGMDRNLCLWEISDVEKNDAICPRTYSSAFVYSEPVWQYCTLEASVYSVAISAEKLFISCGKPSLFIYDLNGKYMNGRSIWKNFSGNITFIAVHPTNDFLGIICGKELLIFSVADEKIVKKVEKECKSIEWVSETTIIGASHSEVFRWDYLCEEIETLLILDFEIRTILCKDDLTFIGTSEGNILTYRNGTREKICVVHNRAVTCLHFENFLMAGSEDGTVSVHKESLLLLEKHYRPVLYVCSIKNIVISASMDHSVQLWDCESGAPISNFRMHQGAVRFCMAFPFGGKKILTASDDQTVRIWNITEKTSAISPPKLPNSKKFECAKTLFPNFHLFIYQQTKENSILSIKNLIQGEKTLESLIFQMSRENAEEIIKTQASCELNLWLKSKEFKLVPKESQEISEEFEEFSFLLNSESFVKYSKKKAEECLLKRKIHKCVIWYLNSGEITKAVQLYVDHKLFIEAIVLSGLFDLDCHSVYRNWAEKLRQNCKTEQAIKCFIGIKDYTSALEEISKIQQTVPVLEIKEMISNKITEKTL